MIDEGAEKIEGEIEVPVTVDEEKKDITVDPDDDSDLERDESGKLFPVDQVVFDERRRQRALARGRVVRRDRNDISGLDEAMRRRKERLRQNHTEK